MLINLHIVDPDGHQSVGRCGDRPPTVECEEEAIGRPSTIVEAARTQLGLEVVVLRVRGLDAVEVELLGGPGEPDLRWHPSSLEPPADRRARWERPGWLELLLVELDRELASLGRARQGPVEQTLHTSVTGMIRAGTTDGPLWVKCIPAMFQHEPLVVRELGKLMPGAVPSSVCTGGGWWAAEEFPPPNSRPVGDPLQVLTELQLRSAPIADDLRRQGCPEVQLSELPDAALAALEQAAHLPDPLRQEIDAGADTLRFACARLGGLGLPLTVVHGDMSPMNTCWSRDGWLIFDWTDACLSHPFIDLASALLYDPPERRSARFELFTSAWSSALPEADLDATGELADIAGSAFQVVNYSRILDGMEGTADDHSSNDHMEALQAFWAYRLCEALAKESAFNVNKIGGGDALSDQ
jgi:hypothetical protein